MTKVAWPRHVPRGGNANLTIPTRLVTTTAPCNRVSLLPGPSQNRIQSVGSANFLAQLWSYWGASYAASYSWLQFYDNWMAGYCHILGNRALIAMSRKSEVSKHSENSADGQHAPYWRCIADPIQLFITTCAENKRKTLGFQFIEIQTYAPE